VSLQKLKNKKKKPTLACLRLVPCELQTNKQKKKAAFQLQKANH
jgi:hypothetical protein